MAAAFRTRAWATLLLGLSFADAFYIPGWSIKSYKEIEAIPLLVNKVYSDNTQLQYAYYDLPFVCPPTGKRHEGSSLLSGEPIPLNLGEVLRGDRIMQSDVELYMGQDQPCNFLCSRTVSRQDLKRAKEMVQEGYVAEWIVDNLPGATSFVTVDRSRKYYAAGFKIGYKDISISGHTRYYINNHLTIVIRYRKAPGKAGERGERVVVGFEVYTKSIGETKRGASGCPSDFDEIDNSLELYIQPNSSDFSAQFPHSSYHPHESEDIEDGATLDIPYTYSVYWREDEGIEWAHRWDLYFVNQEEGSRIHWLAIINSLIISGLLSAIVAMILARTVRSDIKTYKDAVLEDGKFKSKLRSKASSGTRTPKIGEKAGGLLDQVGDTENDADVSSDEEPLEDVTGWKLLHGDVFRAPAYGYLLAPLIGSGMQLVFMSVGLLILSSLGILNPSFRGGFVSVGVGLFIFAGVFSGYFSGRVYKTFGGVNWRKNTIVTALLFPGLLFGLVSVLNLFVWAQASSTALPFTTLISIILLWLCVQLPLVYIGSWYGYFRTGPWEHPTKTTTLPRQVPPQAWYIQAPQAVLLAGLIPFAVIFIELLFVFQSLWQDKSGYYYVFGFLSVVSVILILTIAEVTVVTIYIKLCSEDYKWWWHSFFIGGGSAIWVFVYSVWYYFTKLHIEGFVSSLLFFSYSLMACVVYGLLCGTVGFLTAYAFVRRIYGAIKAD